jgi:hypothetical protein
LPPTTQEIKSKNKNKNKNILSSVGAGGLLGEAAPPSSIAAAPIPNSFSNFISSFLALIDNQVFLHAIKSKLSETSSTATCFGAGLIVKCPHAPTEQPCNFDPSNENKLG